MAESTHINIVNLESIKIIILLNNDCYLIAIL